MKIALVDDEVTQLEKLVTLKSVCPLVDFSSCGQMNLAALSIFFCP